VDTGLASLPMATVPLETELDPLRPPGAVLVHRDGLPVVAHYGSVAAEIAVATKAAGLIDRSGLRQLTIEGPAPLVDHVLTAAVPAGAPDAGRACLIAGTWCCRVTARRAIVAGAPSAIARWRQVATRAISTAGLAVDATVPPDAAALTLVGPRAALVIDGTGLPADLEPNEVAEGTLAGSPVTVLCEEPDSFLLLFEHGHPPAVWQALWQAGRDYGLAPVGNEALDLMRAAHRPLG
jgi:glycine cleavage system aminomethyltransferase T